MKPSLLLALLALLPLAAATPIPYDNCGDAADWVQITSATADVWPPIPGQVLTVTVGGDVREELTGGSYTLAVALDGWQMLDTQGNLNDLPSLSWPVKAGPVTLTRAFQLPALVGAGTSVVVNVTAADPRARPLLCIGLAFVVPDPAAEALGSNAQALQAKQIEELLTLLDAGDAHGDWSLSGSEQQQDSSIHPPTEALVTDGGAWNAAPFAGKSASPAQAAPSEAEESLLFAPPSISIEDLSEREVLAALSVLAGGQLTHPFKLGVDDPIPVPYKSCGQPSDLITIESVTSTVWPPAAGTTASITASFIVTQQVNGGNYNAQVSVDGFPVMNATNTLASMVQLPMAVGPLSLTRNVTLPSPLPFSGEIGLQVAATNEANAELFCLALAFTI